MKQLNLLKTLFLLCALMVGSSSVWADTAGFSLTAMPGTQTQKTGTITGTQSESWSWTVATSNTMYSNTSSENWQIGSKTNPITSLTLSTSGIPGTITSIVVKCASYNGIGTVSAKVGTTDFQTSGSETAPAVPSWSNSACSDVTFTGSASGDIEIVMTNGTGGRAMYLKSVTVTYSTDARTPIATIGDLTPMEIEKDATGTFTVGVTAAAAYTVSYESSDDDILLVDASGEYGGIAKGNATITVTVTPDDAVTYKPVSKAFEVEVYDPTEKGTKWTPFTVAEAIAHIDGGSDLTNKYVKGIIHSVESYNSTYHSITYWISDDGTTDAFEVYSGKGLDGADFSDASDLRQGDIVVVKGTLKKFGDVYEFDKNNELYSIKYATKYVTDAGYATYVAEFDMEFDEGDAFAVTVDGGVAKLAGVTKVKANTPVLLKGEGYKNVTILAETPAAITTDLKVSTGGDPADAYVLANKGGKVGFYKWNGGSLTSGKVYLYAPGLSAHEYIAFDGEESGDVTGINEVAADKTFNGEFFNLAGQRVAQPTKGLYIVNGKKVIIK